MSPRKTCSPQRTLGATSPKRRKGVYSGAATFGRIISVIAVVIGTLTGLILIPYGIYMIVHKEKLTSTTVGEITGDPMCNPSDPGGNNKIVYDCSFTVDYKIDNTNYSIDVNTSTGFKYSNGSSITVYYNPKDPSAGAIKSDSSHVAGIIILAVGIIIPLISWLWWYFAKKNKIVGA